MGPNAGMSESAISARDLRKSYGSNEAVRGIDLEVASGEVFGFLGTNGAGKTTTIEMLEGYRKRSGGEALVLGVDPGEPTREWRERIGLVLQECELDPMLTVEETVSLFASFYRAPRKPGEVIDLVGLADKRDARVGTLSGGQRRRVDVAVGIIGDPDLVFLDEPTTGFDPAARRDAWNMIEGLRQLGTTIFLTTHYMDEAQHLADRVAILRRGEIVAEGTAESLSANLGEDTIVRFRVPDGVGAGAIGAAIGETVELAGGIAEIKSSDAQRTLYRLTNWAERERARLVDLEAVRPSLEDIFLEVTGADAPPESGGQGV